MKHFKSIVPASIQAKILSVVELAKDDFINDQPSETMICCEKVEEISGVGCDGFIPFQDGGYAVQALYRSDIDSSYHFTTKQTEWVNDQSKQCFDSFLSDNKLESGLEWGNLTEAQKEEFSTYECDWFSDGAWLTLNVFANVEESYLGNNKSGVTVQLLLNYKDGQYGRDKYADVLYQKTYSFEEFEAMSEADIIADIKY